MNAYWHNVLESCTLCPRNCRVNRRNGQIGYCHETADLSASRASLHMWEEPCLSGKEGAGTVFFTGCNLKCAFCQNYEVSRAQRSSGSRAGVYRTPAGMISFPPKSALPRSSSVKRYRSICSPSP